LKGGCPPEKISRTPAWLPTEKEPDAASQAVAAWMAEAPTFLYIGHFLPTKGVEPLLEAMAQMPKETRLLLAWSGLGNRPDIDARIRLLNLQARVRIADHPIHRKLICGQALALVAPFPVSYGQVSPPVVVLEAFRAGVPVLVSRLACLEGLVEEGRTGLFIDPYDPASIAQKLAWLLAEPARVVSMRDQQRQTFVQLQSKVNPRSLYESVQLNSHG
jgi:glycosyltransferase involved in cell wall biosynthesis